MGLSTGALADAVQLAIASDTPGTHDMGLFLHNSFGKEPFSTIVGPIKDRGPASGLGIVVDMEEGTRAGGCPRAGRG